MKLILLLVFAFLPVAGSLLAQPIYAKSSAECEYELSDSTCLTFDPLLDFWTVKEEGYVRGIVEERFRETGKGLEAAITASHYFVDELLKWISRSPKATRSDLATAADRIAREIVYGDLFASGLVPSRCVGVLPSATPRVEENCP